MVVVGGLPGVVVLTPRKQSGGRTERRTVTAHDDKVTGLSQTVGEQDRLSREDLSTKGRTRLYILTWGKRQVLALCQVLLRTARAWCQDQGRDTGL